MSAKPENEEEGSNVLLFPGVAHATPPNNNDISKILKKAGRCIVDEVICIGLNKEGDRVLFTTEMTQPELISILSQLIHDFNAGRYE
jgi:hypothetical protein